MVRRVFLFVVLLVLVFGLPAGAFAGDDEMPAPASVAAWILSENEADLERAVHALAGAPPAYVAAVVRHVRQLRAMPASPAEVEPSAVLLQMRAYAVERGVVKTLLGETRLRGTHLLDEAEAEALRAALEQLDGSEVLTAPSLLIEDHQHGTIETLKPVSYVKSVRARAEGRTVVADPVFDVVHEGLSLEVHPVVSADLSRITLAGGVTQTVVERPIPTQEVRIEGGAGKARIQVPTVRERHLDLHFTVPDGGTLVGTGLPHPEDPGREVLVLVRVRRFRGAGAEPPEGLPAPDPTRVVTMEIRLLSVADHVLERVLGNAIPDPDHPLRGLEAAEVVGLLGPGRKGVQGVTVHSAPRLTTHDGQQANISVLNQTSYVKDFDVEVGNEQTILDPIIDTIQDGLVFEVTPTINADRTRIAFETLTTWAVLTRPIAEHTTTLGGRDVTIQIPELNVNRLRRAFELSAGAYALLGGLSAGQDGRRTFVLLTASVTALDPDVRDLLGEEIDLTPR